MSSVNVIIFKTKKKTQYAQHIIPHAPLVEMNFFLASHLLFITVILIIELPIEDNTFSLKMV